MSAPSSWCSSKAVRIRYHLYDKFKVWEGGREAPCYFDLWEWVRSTSGLNPPAREAILDRLGALLVEMTPQSAAYRVPWSPIDLVDFNLCWELRGTSEIVKQALLEPVLFSVFQHEVNQAIPNAPLRLFVAHDDSQRLFDSGRTSNGELATLEELVSLTRGSGVAGLVSVQTTIGLSRKLTANLATRFVGRLGGHEDYTRAGSDLGLSRAQIEWAKANLRPGLFLVQRADGDWREPCVAQVPHVPINELVSDDEVAASVQALDRLRTVPATEFADWKPYHSIDVKTPSVDRESASTSPFSGPEPIESQPSDVELRYIRAVIENPGTPSSVVAKLARMGPQRAQNIRRRLVDLGYLREHRVSTGKRGRAAIVLEPLEPALQLAREEESDRP